MSIIIDRRCSMRARISKWGNSLAIRLPKAVADGLGAHAGEELELTIDGGTVVIRPARPRYRLADLLAGITPDNQPEPIDVSPVGRETL